MASAETTPQIDEEQPSRFVVGIDLGTTNSAVSFVDTHRRAGERQRLETFAIPQLVDVASCEARETLPSFHFEPLPESIPAGGLPLPWGRATGPVVGHWAREAGLALPGRQVASAKSWLCHTGVDRTANLLPWRGAADVERISPVVASSRYLAHIRQAWDHQHPGEPLSRQDVVLTLPASFDEVARELTVEAARAAGLPRITLIEEPQAAFYAWIDRHDQEWDQLVQPGQRILVCDIGGGTTDFTLIHVRRGQAGPQFHRIAVGDHLILGGDNLDLALAHHLEGKLGKQLEPRQWDVLIRACRTAKEILLGAEPPASWTVNLPGAGSRLLGGGLQVTVERDEVRQLLLEGFLPEVTLDAKPTRSSSGFQEFGLPYAADPGITRHLAAFLSAHRQTLSQHVERSAEASGEPGIESGVESNAAPGVASGDRGGVDPARPDIVLFNGGFFASPLLRGRLLEILGSWFPAPAGSTGWQPIELDNERLDLAVSRGAAYYGLVRRGAGVRISASLARSYYLGIESDPPQAVCLVPGAAEPGQSIELTDRVFELLVSQPVEFPLYVSSVRLADLAGDLIEIDPEQLSALPPIRTALRKQRRQEADRARVHLHAHLSELGTIEMWCRELDGPRSWRLQFDVRSTTQTDIQAHGGQGEREGVLDEASWEAAREVLLQCYGPTAAASPERLVKQLAAALEMPREEWPPSLLRRIWEQLMELEPGRRRSQAHEARWLNLLGYSLRPGYGMAVDDWRVLETWKTVQGKLAFQSPQGRTELLILWRRLAGGLTAGQQQTLAEPLISPLRSFHRQLKAGRGGKARGLSPHESTEIWRLLASLELLPERLKVELGGIVADLLPKRSMEPLRPALSWALARLGARCPFYGPLNSVLEPQRVEPWLEVVLDLEPDPHTQLAAMLLARRTNDRYRDLSEPLRARAEAWLEASQASPHLVQLVREAGGDLDQREREQVFGESLPHGLRLGS